MIVSEVRRFAVALVAAVLIHTAFFLVIRIPDIDDVAPAADFHVEYSGVGSGAGKTVALSGESAHELSAAVSEEQAPHALMAERTPATGEPGLAALPGAVATEVPVAVGEASSGGAEARPVVAEEHLGAGRGGPVTQSNAAGDFQIERAGSGAQEAESTAGEAGADAELSRGAEESLATGSSTPGGAAGGDPITIEPTRFVEPEYPEEARRRGITGTVVVHVTVSERRRVGSVAVVDSGGSDLLADAVVRAVRLWRYPRGAEGAVSTHRFVFTLRGR